jgi:sugar phosphate isomerase/epimerase
MFNEINDPNFGLEWEPSHQIDQFIDPIQQLKKWVGKVIHIHGKDCHVDYNKLQEVGILSCINYSTHCFPGFGDTNWKDIFSILKKNNYQGEISIEGFHDPVYNGDKEIEGQILALNYLRKCREES